MPRTTHSVASRKRKKKIFKRAKGFVGGRRTLLRTAKETVARAMAFATRDRKQRKRQFPSSGMSGSTRRAANGLYSRFINT